MEPDCSRVGSMSLLNMALVYIYVGLGKSHLVICLPPRVWVISFDRASALCHVTMTSDPLTSNTTKSSVMSPICSREVFLWIFQPPSDSLLVLIHKHHIPMSRIDDVGNIMAHLRSGHFLSTSAHYPGSWSRDSLSVPWSLQCLNGPDNIFNSIFRKTIFILLPKKYGISIINI